jgi:hypothetical protein
LRIRAFISCCGIRYLWVRFEGCHVRERVLECRRRECISCFHHTLWLGDWRAESVAMSPREGWFAVPNREVVVGHRERARTARSHRASRNPVLEARTPGVAGSKPGSLSGGVGW